MAAAAKGQKETQLIQIDPRKVRVLPDWNYRAIQEEQVEHLESMYEEHGFWPTDAILVRELREGEKKAGLDKGPNGEEYLYGVIKGDHRLRAAWRMMEKAPDFKIWAQLASKSYTDTELRLMNLESNKPAQASPAEEGLLYKALQRAGKSISSISKQAGRSEQWVRDCLDFANKAGEELIEKVKNKELAFRVAQAIIQASQEDSNPEISQLERLKMAGEAKEKKEQALEMFRILQSILAERLGTKTVAREAVEERGEIWNKLTPREQESWALAEKALAEAEAELGIALTPTENFPDSSETHGGEEGGEGEEDSEEEDNEEYVVSGNPIERRARMREIFEDHLLTLQEWEREEYSHIDPLNLAPENPLFEALGEEYRANYEAQAKFIQDEANRRLLDKKNKKHKSAQEKLDEEFSLLWGDSEKALKDKGGINWNVNEFREKGSNYEHLTPPLQLRWSEYFSKLDKLHPPSQPHGETNQGDRGNEEKYGKDLELFNRYLEKAGYTGPSGGGIVALVEDIKKEELMKAVYLLGQLHAKGFPSGEPRSIVIS